MASYDLTATVLPFLTPALIAPLLKQLQDRKVYPEEFLVKQRNNVLSKTSNYTELLALAEQYPSIITADQKAQYVTAKATADEQFDIAFQALGEPLGAFVNQVAEMQLRDLQTLQKTAIEAEVRPLQPQLPALLAYAAAAVANGHFLKGATAYLVYFLAVDGSISKPVAWSMVESALLAQQHHMALLEVFMKKLRELIDTASSSMTLAQQSKQRATFLAYALYGFTTDAPSNALLAQCTLWSDMISSQSMATSASPAFSQHAQERLLNALLFDAPALFRYVVLSTVIAIRVPSSQITPWLLKKNYFVRELTRVIQIQFPNVAAKDQTDPIIRFFQYAVMEFDIPAALETLHKDVPVVFATDIFLKSKALQLDFYQAAKAILVDTTLRLNTNITIAGLRAMLPFNIQFEDFDNTIQLISTKASAAPAAAAPAATPEATTDAAAAPAVVEAVDGKEDGADEKQEPVVVAVETRLVSPLLAQQNYHLRIMKKAKASQQAATATAAKTR